MPKSGADHLSRIKMRIYVEGKLRDFSRTKDPETLASSDALRVALALVELSRAAKPLDLAGLAAAGNYFLARYSALNPSDAKDFELAILLFSQVSLHDVDLVPATVVPHLKPVDDRLPSADESQAAADRGVRWMRHAESNGDLMAAESAVRELSNAVELARDRPGQQAQHLNNLGYAWRVKFDLSHDLSHLERAIESSRRSVDNFTANDPLRAAALNGLGGLLFTRAKYLGGQDDFDAAIAMLREAHHDIEPDSDFMPLVLTNLGVALHERYDVKGDLQDLEEAIALLRRAHNLIPERDRSRFIVESNLATALSLRYQRYTRQINDLDDAIALLQVAWQRVAPVDTHRPVIAINLSKMLRDRFLYNRNQADAIQAEAVLREAMANRATDDYWYGELASRLVDALLLLRETGRGIDSTIRAVALAAIPLKPPSAEGLITWAYANAEAGRPSDSIRELRQVAYSTTESTRAQIEACIAWARIATSIDKSSALAAYMRVIERMPALAGEHLPDVSRMYLIGEFNGIASEAASLAIALGRPCDAVECLELGRMLWWTQIANSNTAATLPGAAARPEFEELRAAAASGPIIILNAGTRRCDAVILTVDDVIILPLNVAFMELRDRATRFSVMWNTDVIDPRRRNRRFERDITDILSWLTSVVTSPIIACLRDHGLIAGPEQRVWWCPTSLFTVFPWHACALDDIVSSYTPNVTSLLRTRQRQQEADVPRLLAVGVADSPGFPPLRHAEAEASDVATYLTGAPTVLLGTQASRDRILAELPRASWLHIACHASQSFRFPLEGGFELSDARLTVADLMHATANSGEFAFLSACETSQASPGMNDELLTVAMALHHVGFPSVIGTGWTIDDADAREVARFVYRDMTKDGRPDGRRAALALHRATRRLREQYPQQPSAWAPYLHIGL